jgi:hypothetical protein
MPAAKPPEFGRKAGRLARRCEQPIEQLARDLGSSRAAVPVAGDGTTDSQAGRASVSRSVQHRR